MGNVGFIPGSHERPLYDQYDGDAWVGCLSDADVAGLDLASAVYPEGPAGTITVHNCRTVHGSTPNLSDRGAAAAAPDLRGRGRLRLHGPGPRERSRRRADSLGKPDTLGAA